MKPFLYALYLTLLFLGFSVAKESSPKVQVYSRLPGEYGKNNIIICHVSRFYPPEIQIQILKNGEVIPKATQTDLAFEGDWHYHLTKHVAFTPINGENYACRVTHLGQAKTYVWESDM